MSAHDFLSNFSNGFMFGMLTSRPAVGCCNPFCSPCMSMPYSFTTPFVPQMTSLWDFSMYSTPITMPVFNFNNMNYNTNLLSYDYFSYSSPTQSVSYTSMPQTYQFNVNFSTLKSPNSSNYTTAISSSNTSSSLSSSVSNTPYTGSSSKVTELYTGSVDALNKKLANRGVLRGKGARFMEMQEKYGISASFLAAICIQESGGTSAQATDSRNLHNVAGITNNGGKGWRKFNSVDDCIEYLARMLKEDYVNKGLVTIEQIHQKYCPPKGNAKDVNGINGGWGSAVSGIKSGIDKAIA